jgi:hypothetical protein
MGSSSKAVVLIGYTIVYANEKSVNAPKVRELRVMFRYGSISPSWAKTGIYFLKQQSLSCLQNITDTYYRPYSKKTF